MNHKISSKQLMYSAAAFIIASSMLTRSMYTFTRNETWISIVIAAVVSYGIVAIYGRLAGTYPGLSLIEIDDAVFGAVGGKIVSAFYVFYFFSLVVLNTNDLGNFVKGFILPSTPITIIYIIFLFVCAFAARKGAVSMTRYAALITIVYIAAVVFNAFLLTNKMHPENMLPVFNIPLKNYFLGAHVAVMLPFCEILVFMMFTPYLQAPAEAGKSLKTGLILAFIVLLLIIVRDIVVQGNYTLVATIPTYSSIRLIDVGDILTRLEIVFAILIVTMLFFKISVLLFSTVKSFSQLLRIEQDSIFIYIVTALGVVYSGGIFQSSFEHQKWFSTAATYSTFFLFVLPAVTLVVSEARNNSRKKQPDEPLKLD